MRVLIVGPRQHADRDGVAVGGTRVLFEETVRQLAARGFELDVVDSSRPRQNLPFWKIRARELWAFARVLLGVLTRVRRNDVVLLNLSSNAAWALATSIWLICAAARRPLALRFFGGSLHRVYGGYGPLRRRLADRGWLRSALIFVETQQLCRDFGGAARVRWLPNTRDIDSPAADRERVRRLIFLGQLRMEKGLGEALEACRSLPGDCRLSVFGPEMPGTDFSLFDGHPRADYGGVLEPPDALAALAQHDLLLCPSYYDGDGHPGVIVEAFQCGVPVVAAVGGGVADLVAHEENGLLIQPRSTGDLRAAITRLIDDPALYRRLCEGARRRGDFFRGARWYDSMAGELRGLAPAGGDRA